MLQEIFETLGFKEEEVKTYLSLLDSGPKTAGDLAKIMGMPRPTLYGYLERLMGSGLVSQSSRQGIKVFAAEPGERIRILYRKKIMELRRKEKSLDDILPELEKRSSMKLMRPRMQFFEGKEGIEMALEDLLKSPPGTMTYAFWAIKAAMAVTSDEFFRYHNKQRIRNDIHIKGIWPRGQGVDINANPFLGWGPEFKRELRYAPKDIEFSMGYWVYGHKTIFISSRAESYGFIMESAEMAELMRVQHQAVWKLSEIIPFDARMVQGFLKELEAGE